MGGLDGPFMSSRGRPVLAGGVRGGEMQMHYASYELAPAHLDPSLLTHQPLSFKVGVEVEKQGWEGVH